METLTVGEASARTGWSPRMLRYVERLGLVVPDRTPAGYRLYGLRELNQLRSLADLRRRFGVALDELVDLDPSDLLEHHRTSGAAATITVCPLRSQFGVVELDSDVVRGFREAPRLDHWVSCGVYVLGDEALKRFPERGDHEATTFPELAEEGRLRAYRHEGLWLTVNTPKDLRVANDYLAAHPAWPAHARG